MRTFKIIALFLLAFLTSCGKPAENFQKDADVIRLRHLQYYAGLLEQYNAATGTYPFMNGGKIETYVHIATPRQEKFTGNGPPYEHKTQSFKSFIIELERALDHEVLEYYDPQYAPNNKPNFYMYMTRGNTYFLAVHVDQAYSFANNIAPQYNKIEISNKPHINNKVSSPHALFTSRDFRTALSYRISKPQFFNSREQKSLRATKNPAK